MNDNDTSNIEEEKPVSNSKTYKEYYENGNLKREGLFVKDEPQGIFKNYARAGKISLFR